MSKTRARFKEAEITRILNAAAKAKVDVRIKIAPDGSITIAPGMPDERNGDAVNPWDEVLDDATEQKRAA